MAKKRAGTFSQSKWKQIEKIIRAGQASGLTREQIAMELDANGIKKSTGKRADKGFVNNCINKLNATLEPVVVNKEVPAPAQPVVLKTVEEAMVPAETIAKDLEFEIEMAWESVQTKPFLVGLIMDQNNMPKRAKLRMIEDLL